MIEDINFTELMAEIDQILVKPFNKSRKSDNSWVTDIDIALDNAIKNYLARHSNAPVYSEEVEFQKLKFPCFIVDPLDGTRDFIRGNGEFSISIAYAQSDDITDKNSNGWIYCPKTQKIYTHHATGSKGTIQNKTDEILVSRNEYEDGTYNAMMKSFVFKPMGSICLKLGMLFNGEGCAVFSARPKSIWDIAAGSILLNKVGISMFENGKLVNKLEHRRYGNTLLWADSLEKYSPLAFGNK